MCKFFSFVTDGKTTRYYFKAKRRKELLLDANPRGLQPDSHSSIATEFELLEDRVNKWEYNPLTQEFIVDQINNGRDDSRLAEAWVRKLDFKNIIPELVVKPIVHPFTITPPEITDKHIKLLRQWDSVRGSICDSVRGSVRGSVGDSVMDSVLDSVWNSVGDSVWDSVRDSVWNSVGDSVWNSVGDSVWSSVGASVGTSVGASVWSYGSSFFILQEWKYTDARNGINPFQSCIDLWEMGIVPSFDSTTWRLHTKNGISFEITKEELAK